MQPDANEFDAFIHGAICGMRLDNAGCLDGIGYQLRRQQGRILDLVFVDVPPREHVVHVTSATATCREHRRETQAV